MPIKKPCKICSKPVRINQHQIFCSVCNTWLHRKCTDMTVAEHLNLVDETYVCPLRELADCLTFESEDELSENDNPIVTPNSNILTSDLPAETASDHGLQL